MTAVVSTRRDNHNISEVSVVVVVFLVVVFVVVFVGLFSEAWKSLRAYFWTCVFPSSGFSVF